MSEHARTIAVAIIGVAFQISCWLAWKRARRQNRLSRMLYVEGAVSPWRLWKAFWCIMVLPVVTVVAILAALAVPVFSNVQSQALEMKAVSNAKQVLIMMKMYAAQNNGQYPDTAPSQVTSSNQAFRRFFQEGLIYEESVFGSVQGAFIPDGMIGQAPEFTQALEPGENHWAITAGQTDTSSGVMPLIFDAPIQASWPPAWAQPTSQRKPGEAMPGGRVVIGRNDGSVTVEKLVPQLGTDLLVPADSDLWLKMDPQNVLNVQLRP